MDTGDIVLCYSNVLTECRDAGGQTLGVSGLLQRVRAIHVQHPTDVVSTLIESIRDEHPENLDAVDATVLLCRATDGSIGWKNNLLAPFRLMGTVSDSTQFE